MVVARVVNRPRLKYKMRWSLRGEVCAVPSRMLRVGAMPAVVHCRVVYIVRHFL